MKIYFKTVSFLLVFVTLFALFSPHVEASETSLKVSAKSVCLIEAKSGRVLYSKNEDARMPMASTTKIMTAIVALESGVPLDTVIKTPQDAVGVEGSSIYLAAGEENTLEVLLYALLLSSANDAALVIAKAVGGTVQDFVALMNEKAATLGLSNTHFANPHGLDDEVHFSTARDLARLMAYAMENEDFRRISGEDKIVVPRDNGGVRVLINHNKLLHTYDGVVAGKTGFTKKSGRCLVSCAERDGLSLIVVTLGAPNDWSDHAALYDFGFENYKMQFFSSIEMEIATISGKNGKILAKSSEFSLFLTRFGGEIETKIEAPRFLFAPVKSGDEVGRVLFIRDGKLIASSPIIALQGDEQISYKFNIFTYLFNLIKGLFN